MTAKDAAGVPRLDYEVVRNRLSSDRFGGCTASGTFYSCRHTGAQAGDPHELVAAKHPKLHATSGHHVGVEGESGEKELSTSSGDGVIVDAIAPIGTRM